jgi:ketopantoate reductase
MVGKPRIAIIYSESKESTNESRQLAFYFCALLAATGHAIIHMVGQHSSGNPCDTSKHQHEKLSYIPPGKCKSHEAPNVEVFHSHWDGLEECAMVIVTVNSEDTERTTAKLSEVLRSRKNVVVFSLQRGVRNSSILRDGYANCSSQKHYKIDLRTFMPM